MIPANMKPVLIACDSDDYKSQMLHSTCSSEYFNFRKFAYPIHV